MKKITAIICTYNRADLLRECLETLTRQTAAPDTFEVLTVNNNSSDTTPDVGSDFSERYPHFRMVTETKQGLSHARNRGYQEAAGEWVLYLDDDAIFPENLIERALWLIDQHDYQMFGGAILPWYRHGKPEWYQDRYVDHRPPPIKSITTLGPNQFAFGGLMLIHKPLLERYGFDPKLGMTGDQVAYGEEIHLQIQLRKEGVRIGYDPELLIYHLVPPHKLNVDWILKTAFARGRDNIVTKKIQISLFNIFLITLVAMGQVVVYSLLYTPKLLGKNYFIQNWLIDVFRKVAKRIGTVYTALLMRSKASPNLEK